MKVLIGFDGSDGARDAIRGLRRAGLARDTEAHVVCLADVWPALPLSAYENPGADPDWQKSPMLRRAQGLAAEAVAHAKAFAAEGAELVHTEFKDWKVSHAAYTGSPYRALVQPPQMQPDLVVVGAHRKSGLECFILGSVSQKVLTHSPCSVRISRTDGKVTDTVNSPVRIILGVDGSVHSAVAVSAVASRSWPVGTQVKVVSVLDLKFWSVLSNPGSEAWARVDEVETDGRTWVNRAVEKVAEELRLAGLVATTRVQEGDPKSILVAEAKLWNADCIFIGAKGHSSLERFLLGSVSAAVAERAQCSVEVVRQGQK